MSFAQTVTFNGTLTAAGTDSDLIEAVPSDDQPLKLVRFILSQGSELGDAAEEGLRITVQRLNTITSGSGGSAPTVELPDPPPSGVVAGTFEANNTTLATGASADVLFDGYWNVRAVLEIPWPDERFAPVAKGVDGLVIRSHTTPADDISFSITAEFLVG